MSRYNQPAKAMVKDSSILAKPIPTSLVSQQTSPNQPMPTSSQKNSPSDSLKWVLASKIWPQSQQDLQSQAKSPSSHPTRHSPQERTGKQSVLLLSITKPMSKSQ